MAPERKVDLQGLVLVFGLLLTTVVPSSLAEVEVRLRAVHAAGGVHRAGGTVPLAVRLESRADRDLTLQVETGIGEGTVRRTLDLPAGSRKSFTFYAGPAGYDGRCEVVLRRSDGRVLGRVPVESSLVQPDETVVAIVGSHALGWNMVKDKRIRRIHLRPVEMPGLAEGLMGIDVIVWPEPRPGTLRPEQISAVARWTERGGLLVLLPGSAWMEASRGALEPWTSIRTRGLVPARSLASLSPIARERPGPFEPPLPVAQLETGGATVWLKEEAGPVAGIEQRTLGTVAVLGFDPSADPLSGWGGWSLFWPRLMNAAGHHLSDRERNVHSPAMTMYGTAPDLRYLVHPYLAEDREIDLPDFEFIGPAFLLYLFLIGPGDYLLLKRWRRLTWTWVTYPVIVILFSLGAYQAALAVLNQETALVRQVLIRDLLPRSDIFADQLHSSKYAGFQGEHTLEAGPSWPIGQPSLNSSQRHRINGFRPQLLRESQSEYEQFPGRVTSRVPKWSWHTATFLGESRAGGAGVVASLRVRDGELSGSVAPGLGEDLDAAYVVAWSRDKPLWFRLGALRDGVSRKAARIRGAEFYEEDSFHEQVGSDPDELGRWVALETVRSLIKFKEGREYMDIMAGPVPSHDWGRFVRRGGMVFVGLRTDRESRVDSGSGSPAVEGLTLYRIPLPDGRAGR